MSSSSVMTQRLAPAAVVLVVAAAMFLAGFAVAWRSMSSGAVYQNDSATYMGVARNVSDGSGLTSPLAHEMTGLSPADAVAHLGAQPLTTWPPLYPIALAAGSPVGLTPESMARLLNALSLGAVLAAIVFLVRRLGGPPLLGLGVAALFLFSLQTLVAFEGIASEPLYLVLQSAALLTLDGLRRGITARRVAVFVALAVAASLTRLVGLHLAPVGAVAVLLLAPASVPRATRARWAALVAFASAAPAVLWLAVAGRAPGFRGGWAYTSRWGELSDSARTVGEWFLPATRLTGAMVPVVGVLVIPLAALAAAGYRPAPSTAAALGPDTDTNTDTDTDAGRRRFALLLLAHVVAYEGVALFSSFFVDRGIPVGHRLMLPAAPAFLAVLAVGLHRLTASASRSPWRLALPIALTLALVASIGLAARDSYDRLLSVDVPGTWAAVPVTPAIAAIDALPPATIIFTNQPSAVYIHTRRPAIALPAEHTKTTGRTNPDYGRDVDQLVEVLRTRPAVLVYERDAAYFDYTHTVSADELRQRVSLEVIAEDAGYVVLAPAPAG